MQWPAPLGVAALVVSGLACVPAARPDPCERCPTSCAEEREHCLAEHVASLTGPVASLAATGGEVVACVGTRTYDPAIETLTEASAVSIIRYDGRVHVAAGPFDGGHQCAGATLGADGRAYVGLVAGVHEGVYRVLRSENVATRIAPLPGMRDLAAYRGEVVLALGTTVFAGLARVTSTGAEHAAELGLTHAPGRLPTKLVVEDEGRVTWSIASTEEILSKASVDAGDIEVLLDGRGSFPRTSGLRDFAVAGDDVFVVLDELILVVPRATPWRFEPLLGRPGEARIAADARAIFVAWWDDERVERIDRQTGTRTTIGEGIRGGVLALDGADLWIGEARGTRLLRVALPAQTGP